MPPKRSCDACRKLKIACTRLDGPDLPCGTCKRRNYACVKPVQVKPKTKNHFRNRFPSDMLTPMGHERGLREGVSSWQMSALEHEGVQAALLDTYKHLDFQITPSSSGHICDDKKTQPDLSIPQQEDFTQPISFAKSPLTSATRTTRSRRPTITIQSLLNG
ncbi:hypothetical protein FA15DRAFT_672254 [Coprinopsis marcescibilis]|uniref:Zn(2)-C6 fungal-type domain-containing protein n=1 Tax=Coprinopsis marcescibilis TaxID=230819 RepID=A0A5C3KNU2_COPMA|nr:hypothetical protein FA15DRAFT_672254 [Coprinopsis marcescibilis]